MAIVPLAPEEQSRSTPGREQLELVGRNDAEPCDQPGMTRRRGSDSRALSLTFSGRFGGRWTVEWEVRLRRDADFCR